MEERAAILIVSALLLALAGCGGAPHQATTKPRVVARPPRWVTSVKVEAGQLCGVGVAGVGFPNSPYPKSLSRERSIRNLAGVLGTRVQEAMIDHATNRRTSLRYARHLHVDDALIEQVDQLAETDYWVDQAGVGPYAQRGFTYGRSCIDASKAASLFKLDAAKLQGGGGNGTSRPEQVPSWTGKVGKQPGGRLCAIGYSLPMFHPDKTFESVVEDVRGQLAHVLQTLVSNYYEELSSERYTFIEMMTVATTEAVSKGAIVTHYWYDRDGIGPHQTKRTTYGWGCVYPVNVLKQTLAKVEEASPVDEQEAVAQVRERAQAAFEDLDAQIEKRETTTAGAQPSVPADVQSRTEPTPSLEDDGASPGDPPVALAAPVTPATPATPATASTDESDRQTDTGKE